MSFYVVSCLIRIQRNRDIVQPVESDNDALNSLVELDPKWTMQEMADTFKVTRSIVQRYLHEIEKLSRFNSFIPTSKPDLTTRHPKKVWYFAFDRTNTDIIHFELLKPSETITTDVYGQ
uniref:Uncharacterized protein n=1 Tax=Vespula pensylvanica TaxID=30213 RepID=A0A834KMW0_VESPE|nr:hypothetical protein H0235_014577 [Vespula pensylvanica]